MKAENKLYITIHRTKEYGSVVIEDYSPLTHLCVSSEKKIKFLLWAIKLLVKFLRQ